MKEYNENTCITAWELRELGMDLPKTIPDYGWIPRTSFSFKAGEMRADVIDTMTCEVIVEITEPFKWYQADIAL